MIQRPWIACNPCVLTRDTCCGLSSRTPFLQDEVTRYVAHGFRLSDFAHAGVYTSDDREGEPWWEASFLERNGLWYRTNVKHKGGYCWFLKPGEGCTLGDDRPAVCKLFPFWVIDGKIDYEPGAEGCDLALQKVPVATAILMMGESRETILRWFGEIKRDAEENADFHKILVRQLLEDEA